MSRLALVSVRWLRNHGLSVTYRSRDGGRLLARFVRPGQSVTLLEAARALGTYPMLLYRLRDAGGLRVSQNGEAIQVPWRELMRLKRQWRGGKATARLAARAKS